VCGDQQVNFIYTHTHTHCFRSMRTICYRDAVWTAADKIGPHCASLKLWV